MSLLNRDRCVSYFKDESGMTVERDVHFVSWQDGDGAFGWEVAAQVACNVLAGEVGYRTGMESVVVVHVKQRVENIPVVLDATGISRRLGRHKVVLKDLPRQIRRTVDFDAFQISMGGHGVCETEQRNAEGTESKHCDLMVVRAVMVHFIDLHKSIYTKLPEAALRAPAPCNVLPTDF